MDIDLTFGQNFHIYTVRFKYADELQLADPNAK
jgi:hypothetical protein